MKTWGFLIFAVGLIIYFVSKKKAFWLFVAGFGAGLWVGAYWALSAMQSAFRNLLP
jgi:hypothetical protein